MSLGLLEVWKEWQPNNHAKKELIILPTSRNYSTQLTADNHFRLQHRFGWSVSVQQGVLGISLPEDVSDPCSIILPHFTSIPKTWPTEETCGQLLKQWLNTNSMATSLPPEIIKSFQHHLHLQTTPLLPPPSFSVQRKSNASVQIQLLHVWSKVSQDNAKWESKWFTKDQSMKKSQTNSVLRSCAVSSCPSLQN